MSSKKLNTLFGSILKFILLFSILINLSCKHDSEEDKDIYYIKYEANSSTIYSGGKLKVEYLNENNELTTIEIPTKNKWEINIGPLKKNFNSSLKVSEIGNNYGKLTLTGQISCSKNNSPFAIKKEDNSSTPRTWYKIDYTIDY